MRVRSFQAADAEFCFRLRSNAFIQQFYGELKPAEVAAAVNAYMPDDFIRMAEQMPFFIVEQVGVPIGFFSLKRKDIRSAELPLIYLDLKQLGQGIGSACIGYIQHWLAQNWPEVDTLSVDTVIPRYNSKFYIKAGFVPGESVFCEFSGRKLKALRLVKKLNEKLDEIERR